MKVAPIGNRPTQELDANEEFERCGCGARCSVTAGVVRVRGPRHRRERGRRAKVYLAPILPGILEGILAEMVLAKSSTPVRLANYAGQYPLIASVTDEWETTSSLRSRPEVNVENRRLASREKNAISFSICR